ncbi:unnamed protein product [Caenorhabditis brenneri]
MPRKASRRRSTSSSTPKFGRKSFVLPDFLIVVNELEHRILELFRLKLQNAMLKEAVNVEMPTDDEAKLEPKYLFGDQVMVIHMCAECQSSKTQIEDYRVGGGNQGLVISLCKICRAHLKHEFLPCTKRRQIQQNQ